MFNLPIEYGDLRQMSMPTRSRILLLMLILALLACNAPSLGPTPTPTATPSPSATPVPSTPTPVAAALVPSQCEGQPLATVPPDMALAGLTATPVVNPELSTLAQLSIFDAVVEKITEVYVDPDFNGLDWPAATERYRTKVEAGLNTEAFYLLIDDLIAQLKDEHSSYESPAEVAEADAQLAGNNDFVGIGILSNPMPDKGLVTILAVFPDSPAELGGLRPHDSLLEVDGAPIIESDNVYVSRIRGPECTAVVLTVQSPGEEPRLVTFVRSHINAPLPIDARLVRTTDGSRIGYIFIPTFFDQTIQDQVRQSLLDFGDLDGLILDNRMNGGGSSTVVEPILSMVTSGTLGHFVSRFSRRELSVTADPVHNSQTVPLVVLVGEDTVSFGEIFAGILQANGRAKVVGQTSLGNVEVEHGYMFDDGSRLWIAEETFVGPNSTQDWEETGIIPDVEAYADWDTFVFETDPAVAAALELLGHK
jgi:carboxyl-terminal processing protease